MLLMNTSISSCFDQNSIQAEMISAVQDNFLTHLWYLSEELVIFGIFDKNLSSDERKSMADQLLLQTRPPHFAPGKPKFQVALLTDDPKLESLIGPKSWVLFHKLKANGNWLNKDPNDWIDDEEYKRMETFLLDLKVVNDLAERCVSDVQNYKDMAKDSEHGNEILIVAGDHRGVFQDLRKQALR